jgi:hypothetical protein
MASNSPRYSIRKYRSFDKDSVVSLKPRKQIISNVYLECLGEFEAIFETALARGSVPYILILKTEARKSRVTVPLSNF